MTDRKPRPLWPILTATLIGLPVLYVLSMGPLYGYTQWHGIPHWLLKPIHVYIAPFQWLKSHGPAWWNDLTEAYLDFWIRWM